MSDTWSPTDWQALPGRHQPRYDDAVALAAALVRLASLPPLVTSGEILALREELQQARAGRRFILHAGECAERLDECTPDLIASRLKVLLQMSLVLEAASGLPVIRIARMAGQYAKPRTSETETRGDQTLPSYFGDLVNAPEFTPDARRPDPARLLAGYHHAALTLNFIRALVDGGFADLQHPEYWELPWTPDDSSEIAKTYRALVTRLGRSSDEAERLRRAGRARPDSGNAFYVSHEALHLACESACTRQVPRRAGWWNLGTHLPWIGDRTRAVDEAHIRYASGIANPVAVKIGPSACPDDLRRLIETLNPRREPGRLLLIHRLGVDRIESLLPPLLTAVSEADPTALWLCDPMHGNTRTAAGDPSRKVRRVEDILAELDAAFDLHERLEIPLHGVHLELTGEDVTECTGGNGGLSEDDLARNYQTRCDPRLNRDQALEVAFLIARRLHAGRALRPALRPQADLVDGHA